MNFPNSLRRCWFKEIMSTLNLGLFVFHFRKKEIEFLLLFVFFFAFFFFKFSVLFSYYDEPELVEFVCRAIEFISKHGWKFLPTYFMDTQRGEWKNRNEKTISENRSLGTANLLKTK
jgi:hypothetical protein